MNNRYYNPERKAWRGRSYKKGGRRIRVECAHDLAEELTDEQIIAIRKETMTPRDFKPWADSIAFARAVIDAARKGEK